jgi:PadR family transcriptional regulator, regulatory protein AphA
MNVKTLCLGFLSLKDATGYEIKKDVEDGLFSHFIEASFGSIYPSLNQLAAEGLVTVREQEQTGKPDKKVYAITDAGRMALTKALCVLPAKDKFKSEFMFQMLLKDAISPEMVLLAIDKQLSDLREDLSSLAECRSEEPQSEGGAFIADYGEAVLTASVTCLEQKRVEIVRHMAAQAAE